MKTQVKRIIYALSSLGVFATFVIGGITIYAKEIKESKGWELKNYQNRDFLISKKTDYLNYDYSFVDTSSEENKVVAKYIPPKSKNNKNSYGLVTLPDNKQLPVQNFVKNYKLKNREYPLFRIKTSYFNFNNRYLVAVNPDDWARFVWWFVGKNENEPGVLSYGPEAGAIKTFQIVPGVKELGSGVTKGHYARTREKAVMTFFPDSYFGNAWIHSGKVWSRAKNKLTNYLFATKPTPWSSKFGEYQTSDFKNEFSIEQIRKILDLINQINKMNSHVERMRDDPQELRKYKILKSTKPEERVKTEKFIEKLRKLEERSEMKGSYGLMGQNSPSPYILVPTDSKIVEGKKVPLYKILGEHFTLREKDSSKKSLIEKLQEEFPEDLTRFQGPYIHKNSKGEFSIQTGENYRFSPSKAIGIPKILKVLNPNFQGMGFDFLKYTSVHEYGHHHTMIDTEDNSEESVLINKLTWNTIGARHSIDAIKSYLKARSKGLQIVQVDPYGVPLTKDGKVLASSPFVKFILPNKKVEKPEEIRGAYIFDKNNKRWIPDVQTNRKKKTYYRAFKNSVDELKHSYIDVYNKKNPLHKTTLYNAYLMNAFDEVSTTLSPEIPISIYKNWSRVWNLPTRDLAPKWYRVKDFTDNWKKSYKAIKKLREKNDKLDRLIPEKWYPLYKEQLEKDNSKKPFIFYLDIKKTWLEKQAGNKEAKPIFLKEIEDHLKIYDEHSHESFIDSEKKAIENLRTATNKVLGFWKKNNLKAIISEVLILEEMEVILTWKPTEFSKKTISHINEFYDEKLTHEKLVANLQQMQKMKIDPEEKNKLPTPHFYRMLEEISTKDSDYFKGKKLEVFQKIKNNILPEVKEVWKESFQEMNFTKMFRKFFNLDKVKFKEDFDFIPIKGSEKAFFDSESKKWTNLEYVLTNFMDKSPTPKPILKKATNNDKADLNLWRDKSILLDSNIWNLRFNLIDPEEILDENGKSFFSFFVQHHLNADEKKQLKSKPETAEEISNKEKFKKQAKYFYLTNILSPIIEIILGIDQIYWRISGPFKLNSQYAEEGLRSVETSHPIHSNYYFEFPEVMTRDYVQIIYSLNKEYLKNTNRFLNFSNQTTTLIYFVDKFLTKTYDLKNKYVNSYFSREIGDAWLNLYDLKLTNEWNKLDNFQKKFYTDIQNPANKVRVIFSVWMRENNIFGVNKYDSTGFERDRQHREVLGWSLYNEDGSEKTRDVQQFTILGPRGEKPRTWAEAYWFFLLKIKGIANTINGGRTISNFYRTLDDDKGYAWGYLDTKENNFEKNKPQYLAFKNQETGKVFHQKIFYHSPKKLFYLKNQGDVKSKHTLADEGFIPWFTQKFHVGSYLSEFLNVGKYEVYFANKDFSVSNVKLSMGRKKYITENNKYYKISSSKFINHSSGKILFQVKKRFGGTE